MTKRKPLAWIDLGRGRVAPDCATCLDYVTQPGMAEAIASVGIETGGVDVRKLVDRYHERRHKEAT